MKDSEGMDRVRASPHALGEQERLLAEMAGREDGRPASGGVRLSFLGGGGGED